MSQLLEQRLRGANPVPNPSDPPSGAWTAEVALLEIERRRDSVHTINQETGPTGPSGRQRNRGWLVAAAVAVVVVLIGGVLIGLQSGSGTDVAGPSQTTLSAPTTVPAAPPDHEVSITVDDDVCIYEGTSTAKVGDTILVSYENVGEGAAYIGFTRLLPPAPEDDLAEYSGVFDVSQADFVSPYDTGVSEPIFEVGDPVEWGTAMPPGTRHVVSFTPSTAGQYVPYCDAQVFENGTWVTSTWYGSYGPAVTVDE